LLRGYLRKQALLFVHKKKCFLAFLNLPRAPASLLETLVGKRDRSKARQHGVQHGSNRFHVIRIGIKLERVDDRATVIIAAITGFQNDC
jgi:hypothetical protein